MGQMSEQIGDPLSHFESRGGLGQAEGPGAMSEVADDAQGHGIAVQHDLQQDLFIFAPSILPPTPHNC